MQIPNLSDDTDILREQINAKDRIIAQKDGMIQDLKKSIDDTYKIQEVQLLELEKSWTDKMAVAEQQIEELKNSVSSDSISHEATQFLKFVKSLLYFTEIHAILKSTFQRIQNLFVNVK